MKFDFTKNRKVDTLDGVPENFRAFYEEAGDDGGFNLRTDAVTTTAVAAISGLNSALTKARADADTAKKNSTVDLSGLATYGTTVEEIVANVNKKVDELTQQKDHSQKSVSDRISQIQKEHTAAIAKLSADKDAELTSKDKTLHNYMLDQSVMQAAGAWPGLNPVLVAPFARERMAVKKIDDQVRVVVLGTDGEARYSKMAERAGELMQPDELLAEMSEQADYKQLFPSKQASTGGGAQPARVPVGVRRTDATAGMTPAQKISAGLNQKK